MAYVRDVNSLTTKLDEVPTPSNTGFGPPTTRDSAFMAPTGMTPEQEKLLSTPTDVALEKTEEVTTAPLELPVVGKIPGGMGMATNRLLEIPWQKTKPGISISSVIPLDDEDYRVNTFMTLDEYENAEGETISLEGYDYATRLSTADKFGATKFVKYDKETGERIVQAVPWEKMVLQQTKIPEKFGGSDLLGGDKFEIYTEGMTLEQYERLVFANRAFSTLITPDPDLGRAIHAQYLNEMLIAAGIGDRGRALIIFDQLENPSNDEMTRLVTGAMDVIGRSVIETALYATGETAGFVGMLIDKKMDGTIADYQTRQAVADSWWKPLAYDVQDYFKKQGVTMNLATAEELARTQTGFAPFLLQFGLEVAAPSKSALAKRGMTAEKDLERFYIFLRQQRRENPKISIDDAVKGFAEQQANNSFLRFIPFSSSKRRIAGYEGRIVTAFQLQETLMEPAERVAVRGAVSRLAALQAQKDHLRERIASPEVEQPFKLKKELEAVDLRINAAEYELRKAERRSSIPKYVTDMKIQDNYIIVGGATVGHFFDENEMDRDFGTILGLGAGIVVSVTKGKVPAALDFTLGHMNKLNPITSVREAAELKFFVREMQRSSPELQEMVNIHGQRIAEYQDRLVAAGVPIEVLQVTLPVITNIVTLRHFEDVIKQRVDTKGIISSEQTQNIQKMASLNQQLNAQLNRVLADFEVSNEVEKEFFDMIDYFRKETAETRDRLSETIKVYNKEGIGHYLNPAVGSKAAITQEGSPVGVPGSEEFMTFDQASESLHNQLLIDNSALPEDEFASVLQEGRDVVNQGLQDAANGMTARVGNAKAAKRQINTEGSIDIEVDATPGGMMSMHLEFEYSAARTFASRRFAHMDGNNAEYAVLGSKVSGVPVVDMKNVFDEAFALEVPGVGKLSRINKDDLSAGELATLDKTIEELTNPFFESMALEKGIDKATLLKDPKASAEAAEYSFGSGRNTQAIVAKYLVETAAQDGVYLPLFEMTPNQVRKVDLAITNLRYRHRDNGQVTRTLVNMSNLTEGKFEQFEIDGVDAGQLQIRDPDSGKLVAFKDYMNAAKRDYFEFKSNWHDMNEDAIIPNLMSWGKRKRNPLGVTADNPTGMKYDKLVSEWITMDMLTDPTQSGRFITSLNKALGQPVGEMGYRLVEGSGNALTAQAYLRAFLGENIAKMASAGELDANKLRLMAADIEQNLKMIDANGTEVPLLPVGEVIDDVLGDWRGNISEELVASVEATNKKKIGMALSNASGPAKKRRNDLSDALAVLNELNGTRANMEQAGIMLVGSGKNGYFKFKEALSVLRDADGSLKYTEAEVDELIASIYLLNTRTKVFSPTGRKLVSTVESGEVKKFAETPELREDPVQFNLMLGQTDEQREVVRMIIGKDRFEVWEAMAGFMSEINNNPIGNSGILINGAPRSLSIESYISRLYAINRGVVRPQYVGTEAVIQSLRFRNYEFLTAALTNPELGNLFLEMVRTGKPLSPKRDARFQELLIQTYAQQSQMHGAESKDVVDVAGRKFTVYATPSDKFRMGYEPTDLKLTLPSLDTGLKPALP